MQHPRTRRVERIRLAEPLRARLGSTEVVLIDLSLLGARIEHHVPLGISTGTHSRLTFRWNDEPIVVECRVIRSRLEHFSTGADGLTVYHSGLEFESVAAETRAQLKATIGAFVVRALEEQRLNALGVTPQHDVTRMPIFRRGGQLSANTKDVRESVGGAQLPTSRMARESGYVCYQLDRRTWRKKRTHDPGQPPEGFTISALEDQDQAQLLCEAYEKCDPEGRRLIQLFAQLSIMDGEGTVPGRFEP